MKNNYDEIYEYAYKCGQDKGYSDGYFIGYNKAIDDFVNDIKENTMFKTFGIREVDIIKIAKQLKGE